MSLRGLPMVVLSKPNRVEDRLNFYVVFVGLQIDERLTRVECLEK